MATWPTIIDDDGSGETGTATDYALFQQVKGYIDASLSEANAAINGAWINVPFSAANFGATGGNWTLTAGNQQRFSYLKFGKTAIVQLFLTSTTITGAPTSLNVVLPFTVLAFQSGMANYFGTTVFGHALYAQPTQDQFARFFRDGYNTPFVAELFNLRAMLVLQIA